MPTTIKIIYSINFDRTLIFTHNIENISITPVDNADDTHAPTIPILGNSHIFKPILITPPIIDITEFTFVFPLAVIIVAYNRFIDEKMTPINISGT